MEFQKMLNFSRSLIPKPLGFFGNVQFFHLTRQWSPCTLSGLLPLQRRLLLKQSISLAAQLGRLYILRK
jgi:hypothetical protein